MFIFINNKFIKIKSSQCDSNTRPIDIYKLLQSIALPTEL